MQKTNINTARVSIVISMLIFGTIGIFVHYIPMPSSVTALIRGVVGTLFLLVFSRVRNTHVDWTTVRANLGMLAVSGAFIGFNWILLFEAYRYTTVPTATLCYYLAPVFVILASPILFREKLTLKKGFCVLGALAGMVLVTGVLETGFSGGSELPGIMFGVGAAVLYASVVIMNKKLTDVQAFDRTVVQLGAAALALVPYVLVTQQDTHLEWTPGVIGLLLLVGVVHTGFAYALYFGAIKELPAQTSAILSYIDPVSAIFLSALFLGERLTLPGTIGAVLVLGCTLVSELPAGHKQN